jgi:hypothetical protein
VNVVTRGLMAAGMGVYAAIHALQAFASPDGAPAWLTVAFAAAAIAGAVLAVLLIVSSTELEARVMTAAAVLAGASLLALVAAGTIGFFGVEETDLRAETAIVAVAELVVLGAFVVERRVESVSATDIRER